MHLSETGAKPEAEASTSAGTDMETEVNDRRRRVRFREEREIHRDIIWTHPRTASRWRTRVGKYQDELRQVNALFLFIPPKQAGLSSSRRVQPQVTIRLERNSI